MNRPVLSVLIGLALSGSSLPVAWADTADSDVNFKIYSPTSTNAPAADAAEVQPTTETTPALDSAEKTSDAAAAEPVAGDKPAEAAEAATSGAADGQQIASKVLQGYIRVVPSGTKIPIIMDTAIDTDTSQEGDEFSARTGEDLSIDGTTVVPAGSVIKGRIAQLNAPRRLDRSGSVAFKFDTVTTPDNRQIPIVANLVARGGVVHARRGMKDVAMETGMFALPTAAGLGIGLLAGGGDSSKIGRGGGAVIGAGIGAAVGVVILLSKKGKKVDVRPGDELKIELAEDLRMPM
jgi:hypothetical protein